MFASWLPSTRKKTGTRVDVVLADFFRNGFEEGLVTLGGAAG